MKKRTLLFYCGLLRFVIAAAALVYKGGSRRKAEAFDTMREAAERYVRALECVRNERLRRGIPISAEDTLGLGLIGLPNSSISTSVGQLEAKRTALLGLQQPVLPNPLARSRRMPLNIAGLYRIASLCNTIRKDAVCQALPLCDRGCYRGDYDLRPSSLASSSYRSTSPLSFSSSSSQSS